MNLVDVVAKFAHTRPNETAFVEVRPVTAARHEVSWRRLDERSNGLARSLLGKGVCKGEKVFLLSRNSINWLEAYFSVLKTGAWAVPLNFRFTDDDIRYCARVAGPAAYIFDAEFAGRIRGLSHELPGIKQYAVVGPDATDAFETMEDLIGKGSPLPLDARSEDECTLYFTSGTTGTPKPVLLRHKNLMCVGLTEAVNHSFVPGDRFLMMPPMYHLAIGHLFGVVIAGGRTVLLTEQISPRHIIETISREGITSVFLLVPWAMDLVEALDRRELRLEDYDLASWRQTFTGAQAVPPSLVRRAKAYFPRITYGTTYGLSESSGPGAIHLAAVDDTPTRPPSVSPPSCGTRG